MYGEWVAFVYNYPIALVCVAEPDRLERNRDNAKKLRQLNSYRGERWKTLSVQRAPRRKHKTSKFQLAKQGLSLHDGRSLKKPHHEDKYTCLCGDLLSKITGANITTILYPIQYFPCVYYRPKRYCPVRVAVISAKNHKCQRRKRQSVTAKREKSQKPKVLTAILTLLNLT